MTSARKFMLSAARLSTSPANRPQRPSSPPLSPGFFVSDFGEPILQRPITHPEHLRRLRDNPVGLFHRLQDNIALQMLEVDPLRRNLEAIAPARPLDPPRALAREHLLRQIAP